MHANSSYTRFPLLFITNPLVDCIDSNFKVLSKTSISLHLHSNYSHSSSHVVTWLYSSFLTDFSPSHPGSLSVSPLSWRPHHLLLSCLFISLWPNWAITITLKSLPLQSLAKTIPFAEEEEEEEEMLFPSSLHVIDSCSLGSAWKNKSPKESVLIVQSVVVRQPLNHINFNGNQSLIIV